MTWAESYHGKFRALAGDEEGLIMIGVRCLLRDDQGRILLIERSDNGLWAVPAGGMELIEHSRIVYDTGPTLPGRTRIRGLHV